MDILQYCNAPATNHRNQLGGVNLIYSSRVLGTVNLEKVILNLERPKRKEKREEVSPKQQVESG